jgi:ABC-type maltose transport system permease subunit
LPEPTGSITSTVACVPPESVVSTSSGRTPRRNRPPVGLFSLVGEYSVPWARFSAFALLFGSPIMMVYLFAQRYIENGLWFDGV